MIKNIKSFSNEQHTMRIRDKVREGWRSVGGRCVVWNKKSGLYYFSQWMVYVPSWLRWLLK